MTVSRGTTEEPPMPESHSKDSTTSKGDGTNMNMNDLGPNELKEAGNKAFKEKRYEQAIEYYTKAIDVARVLDNDTPTLVRLYSNRAA